MYGMINDAVRGLVTSAFGADKWTKIHQRAGVDESFVSMKTYDDDVTYRLVAAASEELDLSPEQVLTAFGEYWVEQVATVAYSQLMNQTGTGFKDFLANLDVMHQRMKSTFPDYQPPSFRVIETSQPGRLQVDYYSNRPGLLPFVIGLLHGLSRHFDEEIEIEHVDDDSHPLPCKRMFVTLGGS
jgi:hypothetical protein